MATCSSAFFVLYLSSSTSVTTESALDCAAFFAFFSSSVSACACLVFLSAFSDAAESVSALCSSKATSSWHFCATFWASSDKCLDADNNAVSDLFCSSSDLSRTCMVFDSSRMLITCCLYLSRSFCSIFRDSIESAYFFSSSCFSFSRFDSSVESDSISSYRLSEFCFSTSRSFRRRLITSSSENLTPLPSLFSASSILSRRLLISCTRSVFLLSNFLLAFCSSSI
mmetsp:Transcript_18013/g.72099  ORF Transcript_18013/g.72099 Transcript_18013/m.72099 type:complete len:226 (-) Transcript_18013:1510-2187(-)